VAGSETCSSSRWIDLTKSGGCGTNEPPPLRRNRRFLRQIPQKNAKSSSASQSVACHPAAGRVRVPLLPTLQELISVPIAGTGGLEKILTLFENFTPSFPEKEVREINGSNQREFLLCGPKNSSSNQNSSKQGK
jgi:hypothetical protein